MTTNVDFEIANALVFPGVGGVQFIEMGFKGVHQRRGGEQVWNHWSKTTGYLWQIESSCFVQFLKQIRTF